MLKKARKKLENILVDKNLVDLNNRNNNKEDNLMLIDSNVYLWKKNKLNSNESDYSNMLELDNNDVNMYYNLFKNKFNENYIIFNFTSSEINNFKDQEKVINVNAPKLPTYTLQFILELTTKVKLLIDNNLYLNNNPVIIFYDYYITVRNLNIK